MDWIASPEVWLSFATLTFLEIILGIDNVVFVSVAAGRLPEQSQPRARRLGIWSGAAMRVALLFVLVGLTQLTHATLFTLPEFLHGVAAGADGAPNEAVVNVTIEDLVLLVGGVFLLWKGTTEIHHAIEGEDDLARAKPTSAFTAVVLQMTLINVVFSLDSVLTAMGMTQNLGGESGQGARLAVMVAAIVLSTLVMVGSAKLVADFLQRHPTTKMLALSFILLVGVALIADGLGFHIPRGYLYFAIAFSLSVETLNVLYRRARRLGAASSGEGDCA